MNTKLFLFVFSIHYCRSVNFYNYISATTTSHNDVPMESIENWLRKPLLNVEHLHLNIRSNNYQQDFANSYTQWFLKQTLVPIKISVYDLSKKKMHNSNNQDSYILVASMKNLRSAARRFQRSAAVYFFIIIGDVNFKDLRSFFNVWWKKFHIYKSFLLTDSGVFIYDPFEGYKSEGYGKIIKYTGKDTIERTIFYDMRGYPLRVQLFKSVYSRPVVDPTTNKVKHIYGVDGRVARLMQKQLNFTMDLQYPDPNYFGERNPNGTYNGVIGSIIRNELDLCLTGFFIKEYMVPELEFSVAVYDDKLCIFTPKAKQVPESILPIFAVRYDLWFGFILMGFVGSSLWAILRAINLRLIKFPMNEKHLKKSFCWQYIKIFVDTWVVWVRVNITKYPPFHSEKIFVASLCLTSVIFGAIFESSLATVYIHPLYYRDIYTLQELDESGLNVVYKYASMGDDLFFSETSPLFANLNKKLRFINDLNADVIEDVAAYGGKAGVTRYTNLMQQSLHLILSKKVWIVPECPKYYSISYVWPKNSPWTNTANQLLLRMLSAGLINKFIAEMQVQVDIKIMKEHLYETHEEYKILTIADLQLAFYVILIGSLSAFLSLMVERKTKGPNEVTINISTYTKR